RWVMYNKRESISSLKHCIPILISEITFSNKQKKIFEILLLFMIKLKSTVLFQGSYFLKKSSNCKLTLFNICYNLINYEVDKKIKNFMLESLLFFLNKKESNFENTDLSYRDKKLRKNSPLLKKSIIKFNKFIFGYLMFFQAKLRTPIY